MLDEQTELRTEQRIDEIAEIAEEILRRSEKPIRQSQLVRDIQQYCRIENISTIPPGTLNANVPRLHTHRPKIFYRTENRGGGIYYSLLLQDVNQEELQNNLPNDTPRRLERDFYPSFAKYLKYAQKDEDELRLNECSKAIPWGDTKSGGKKLDGKWITPDVVGVFKPEPGSPVEFPHEIITAEIKNADSKNLLIEAFGQACAYRLFSHKVYLVVPKSGQYERLESLCHILGIGLVYFEQPKPDTPVDKININIYTTKLRAQKHEPDMFYVNEFIKGDLLDLYR